MSDHLGTVQPAPPARSVTNNAHSDFFQRHQTPAMAAFSDRDTAGSDVPVEAFAELNAWGMMGAESGKRRFPDRVMYSKNNVMPLSCDPRNGPEWMQTPAKLKSDYVREQRNIDTCSVLAGKIDEERQLHQKFQALHKTKQKVGGTEDQTEIMKRAVRGAKLPSAIAGPHDKHQESNKLPELRDLIPKDRTSKYVASLSAPSRRVLQMQTLIELEVPLGAAGVSAPASSRGSSPRQPQSARKPSHPKPSTMGWTPRKDPIPPATARNAKFMKSKAVGVDAEDAPGAYCPKDDKGKKLSWRHRYAELRDALAVERRMAEQTWQEVERELELRGDRTDIVL